MIEWQPIETAPRDGTTVLLVCPTFQDPVFIGRFMDVEEFRYGVRVRKRRYWSIPWIINMDDPQPTHWMPIPKAPSNA